MRLLKIKLGQIWDNFIFLLLILLYLIIMTILSVIFMVRCIWTDSVDVREDMNYMKAMIPDRDLMLKWGENLRDYRKKTNDRQP